MGIIKYSPYQGLHLLENVAVEDTSLNSPDYFRIEEFPSSLTAGKNMFLIEGNTNTIESFSEIRFECLDSTGKNVYMEVPSYIDPNGLRMITVWVYPWTAGGFGLVTLCAQLKSTLTTDAAGKIVSKANPSENEKPEFVRWRRLININPTQKNKSRIVFGRQPKVEIKEINHEYLTRTFPVGTEVTSSSTGQIQQISTTNGTTTMTTDGVFQLTSDMEGGTITVSTNDVNYVNLPWYIWISGEDETNYTGVIDTVLTPTTAIMDTPFQLKSGTSGINVWSGYTSTYGTYPWTMVASDYTLNWTQAPTYSTGSGNIESYAHIVLANIDPISGDAQRVKTYMRSHGFNNWDLVGDDDLDYKELLLDGDSIEITKKTGYFIDDAVVDTYWSASAFGYQISNTTPSLTRQSASLMDSMKISGSEQFKNAGLRKNAFIKVENTKPIRFFKGDTYQISFQASSNRDDIDRREEEIVIHMSGSAFDYTEASNLGKEIITVGEENNWTSMGGNATVQEGPGGAQVSIPNQTSPANGQQGSNMAPKPVSGIVTQYQTDENEQGYWHAAGAGLINEPARLAYEFTADKDGFGVPVFQVRAGVWHISQVSVQSVNIFGFTPNHSFILTHVPTTHMNDILDFKFEFYDNDNNRADLILTSESIDFSGSNFFIQESQLLGPVDIGPDATDVGMQLLGLDSAILRTMNPTYPGFDNAKTRGGGIIIYSGSLSKPGKSYEGSGSYYGVGMELVGSHNHPMSASWLRFRTQTGSAGGDGGELDIRAKKFFIGNPTNQYISASQGKIEISSSNFHLTNTGDVTMQGTITAEAGGNIGDWEISSNYISKALTGHTNTDYSRVYLSTTEDNTQNIQQGLQIYRDDDDTDAGDVKIIRIGGLSNTGNLHSATDYGIQVIKNKTATTYENLIYIGKTTQTISGWNLYADSLSGGNLNLNKNGTISSSTWQISSSKEDSDPAGFISSSAFKASADGRITGSQVLFSGGTIAGWTMTDSILSSIDDNGGVKFDSDNKQIGIRTGSHVDTTIVEFGRIGGTVGSPKFGIEGLDTSGNVIFTIGENGNEIAGWTLEDTKFSSNNIIISSSGEIKTADFQSSLGGMGKGYRLGEDGIAEFEEARIRGTLSTAVFEKDTISAVGGALIVANATSLKSGSLILSQSLLGQVVPSSSLVVDNSAGFAAGEFLVAKATSSAGGFVEELMKIHSIDSATNTLVVSRSLNYLGAKGTYTAQLITSMSAGQTLVSQGKKDTGYILLNATSGSNTPFIDIVERTGSGVLDTATKVRLGDLTGINDPEMPSVSGYGLYTDNVFLKGIISSSAGNIGGVDIQAAALRYKDKWRISASEVDLPGRFISSSKFKVSAEGNVTASNLLINSAKAVNFSERVVVVTSGNKTLYMADDNNYSGTSDGVKLLFDGSGGGLVCQHMILNVAPEHTTLGAPQEISDIAFPNFGTGVTQDVTIEINCNGVQFSDDGNIGPR